MGFQMNATAKAERTCGACTLCCKMFEIPSLNKSAGAWCTHCKPGRGCGIYETRPQDCHDFSCLWLLDDRIGDEFRPDRTKVVFLMDAGGQRIWARCDHQAPLAWRDQPVYGLLKQMARAAIGTQRQILAYSRGNAIAIFPGKDVEIGPVKPGEIIIYEYKQGPAGEDIRPYVAPAGTVV